MHHASRIFIAPKNTRIVITTRLAEQIVENLVELGFKNLHAIVFGRGEARIERFIALKNQEKQEFILIQNFVTYQAPGVT